MSPPTHIMSGSSAASIDRRQSWSLPRWLKIAATVGVLFLLSTQVKWSEVLNTLSSASTVGILVVLALWLPNQWLQYVRWKLIAKRASTLPLRKDIIESYWLGHTLAFITPGRIGAYGRGLLLSNVKLGEATALTVLERAYSAITVNGFGLIALAVLPRIGWQASWANWGTSVSVLLATFGIVILSAGIFPGWIASILAKFARNRKHGQGLASSLESLSRLPLGSSLLYLTLASGSLLISLIQFQLILSALGTSLPIFAGLLTIHLNFFLKGNIPLTLGNLGVGEWTALLCLRGLGVPDSTAVAASLTLFSLNVAIPALIGVRHVKRIFTFHHDWKNRA